MIKKIMLAWRVGGNSIAKDLISVSVVYGGEWKGGRGNNV